MTIETVRILCASCGAAIAIPADLDQISCAHCGTPLAIVHGDGFVAALLAKAVTRTIETSAASTQAELRRLQFQQERLLPRTQEHRSPAYGQIMYWHT